MTVGAAAGVVVTVVVVVESAVEVATTESRVAVVSYTVEVKVLFTY